MVKMVISLRMCCYICLIQKILDDFTKEAVLFNSSMSLMESRSGNFVSQVLPNLDVSILQGEDIGEMLNATRIYYMIGEGNRYR